MENIYYLLAIGQFNSPHVEKTVESIASAVRTDGGAKVWVKTPVGSSDVLPFTQYTKAEMLIEKKKWQPNI